MTKERAKIGFGDNLETFDPNEWTAKKGQGTTTAHKLPKEEIRKVAEQTGFTSREGTSPQKTIPETENRYVHRTGRDAQFNTKVHPKVKQAYYSIREKTKKPLGEILELALAAYERETQTSKSSTPTK